ncbi:restriction endonuclease [Frankia tisae]|uniref:restriction system modified-DNA reader domain-containing protein n=1 Tax=Frankia tisae TaxID=2950104 RepID=UPI0021BF63B1|nr:restriction endonuclease [Frankia tisae]
MRVARTLQETLKECAERLRRYRHGQRIGEQNTKASLIEPVIEALGWDIHDLDEVNREYRFGPSANPVDYALLLLRRPRLFIEAKGLGEDLSQLRWATQVLSYATSAGVRWVVLTNGDEWRIYNAHAPVPVDQKLYRSVSISADPGGAADVLALLSKDAMNGDRIDDLWRAEFVDGQLRSALAELFDGGDPAAELVSLVHRRTRDLSEADVRAGLIRARATFDFPAAGSAPSASSRPPAASPPPSPGGAGAGAAGSSPRPSSTVSATTGPPASTVVASTSVPASVPTSVPTSATSPARITPEERSLKLTDLLNAGIVQPGSTLTADYRGGRRTAEVLPDGKVRFGGERLSLSAAGAAAKVDIAGPGLPDSARQTDGWEFWKAPDPTSGQLISLRNLRRDLARSLPRRPSP